MLKKFAATGVVTVAVAGALMVASPASAHDITTNDESLLSGNQLSVPIAIPINVCGNALAVLGSARAGC